MRNCIVSTKLKSQNRIMAQQDCPWVSAVFRIWSRYFTWSHFRRAYRFFIILLSFSFNWTNSLAFYVVKIFWIVFFTLEVHSHMLWNKLGNQDRRRCAVEESLPHYRFNRISDMNFEVLVVSPTDFLVTYAKITLVNQSHSKQGFGGLFRLS